MIWVSVLILFVTLLIFNEVTFIMATVPQVNEALDAIKARLEAIDATVEALYQMLADAQQGGEGATPEELDGFIAKLGEIRTVADAVETDN